MATLSAIRNNESITNANAAGVDMKVEVVIIPVSDVDRAKEFYSRLGWRLDADFTDGNDWRGVQFTPPGSGCSVNFGKNVTTTAPGSAQGLYLAVSDIESARKELLRRGVEVSEVFHGSNLHTGPDEPYLFGRLRASGPDPRHTSCFSFASFHNPAADTCVNTHTSLSLAELYRPGIRPDVSPLRQRSQNRREIITP